MDAEDERLGEAPNFDLIVEYPCGSVNQGCPEHFKSGSLTDPAEQGPCPAVRISGKSQI